MSSELEKIEKKRQELERASLEARREIVEEFEQTKEDLKGILKRTLTIGGGLLVSYLIFKGLFGRSGDAQDKKKVRG